MWKYLMIVMISTACIAQRTSEEKGTLKGSIGIYEGNCMPSPGVPPCEPSPISTIVYITALSETFDQDLVSASARSAENGQYQIDLPAGVYSLFLKDGDKVVCDLIKCPDKCYCNPFEIVADSVTIIDANIDHASW